ncbi:RNA polymerase sigma-70 factor [Candidatus Poribacteria bacterium]|nr:RNA polymerase sigma-70 factor [Candidatus Poribacteria bacterium]
MPGNRTYKKRRKLKMGTATGIETISYVDRAVLVERFQRGELSAFDEIVKRCQKHVYNLAYRFTRNCEDSYDISQEVFIKVFKSLDKLKNTSAFDAWLRRVTVNACMDHLRKQPGEKIFEDITDVEIRQSVTNKETVNPDTPLEDNELQRIISRAVQQLPNKQRKVFILRHYEGLALKEIAEAMDCSLGTVKAHLFRATRRLRKILRPYNTQYSQ